MAHFFQGIAAAQAQQAHAQALEDSKLQQQVLKHSIERLRIDDQLRTRQLKQEALAAQQGQPEADLPHEDYQAPNLPSTSHAGAMTGIPGVVANLVRDRMGFGDEQTMDLQRSRNPLASMPAPEAQATAQGTHTQSRIAAVDIPGVDGVGGYRQRPMSMEEGIQARAAAKLREPVSLKEGEDYYPQGLEGPKYAGRPKPSPQLSEFGAFQQSYAKGLGQASFADLTPSQQNGVHKAFAESKRQAPNPTEASLALAAQDPDPSVAGPAKAALATMRAQRPRSSAEGGPVTIPGNAEAPNVAPGERNDAYLQSLDAPTAALVKSLVEGRKAFPAGAALRSEYWQRMLGAVAKYDPAFDEVNYNSRAATRKDFMSGKSAQTINALNTVVQHLDRLSTSVDGLNNSWSPAYNSIANWASKHAGSKIVTNFQTDKKAVVDELTKAWRQSGGTEGDIKSWSEVLDAANSPEQLHGAIAEMGHLLEGKLSALADQYTQGMGASPDRPVIMPAARAVLTRLEQKAGLSTESPATAAGEPTEGETKPIEGYPGTEQTFRHGKWIRTK